MAMTYDQLTTLVYLEYGDVAEAYEKYVKYNPDFDKSFNMMLILKAEPTGYWPVIGWLAKYSENPVLREAYQEFATTSC